MWIENKYGLQISKELVDKYCENLIGGFYKCLPLYEGRDFKTKVIIYPPSVAHEHFLKYIQNFIVEICGAFYLFDNDIRFMKLLNLVEGMQTIKVDEHKKLKSLVLHCIDICKKLKGVEA